MPTLDAHARGLAEAAGRRDRLVIGDARRGEVFAARYDRDGAALWGPVVCPPEQLASRLCAEAPCLAAGAGAVRFRQLLASRDVEIPDDSEPVHRIDARHVCALAAEAEAERSGSLVPIYLRPPDAERWLERDSVQATQ